MQLMRLRRSDTGFLVKRNKLADRFRELAALRLAKRIPASDIFKARYKDREAKRVEARIVEGERIGQRLQERDQQLPALQSFDLRVGRRRNLDDRLNPGVGIGDQLGARLEEEIVAEAGR